MKADMSSALGVADLTLNYEHHKGGVKAKFTLKDFQVACAELIGTFFLALIIGSTKITASPGAAPFAIGFGLVALVYSFGAVSGAQLNPAVTIGLVARNKLNLYEAAYCIMAQLTGALLAGGVCYGLYNNDWDNVGYPSVSDDGRREEAFVAELLQTFALVTVVLNTATTKAQANNSYFGLAIGFVVLSGALVIGNVSGACFNPAVAMLTLLQRDYEDLWVFIFGPLVGGVAAGFIFRITNPTGSLLSAVLPTKLPYAFFF
jgi:aquaporin Z